VVGKRNREVIAGKMPLVMSLSGGKKTSTGNAGGMETECDDDDEIECDDDEVEVVVAAPVSASARTTRQAAVEAKQRLGKTASALSVEGGEPDDSLEGRALGELLQARAAVRFVANAVGTTGRGARG